MTPRQRIYFQPSYRGDSLLPADVNVLHLILKVLLTFSLCSACFLRRALLSVAVFYLAIVQAYVFRRFAAAARMISAATATFAASECDGGHGQ